MGLLPFEKRDFKVIERYESKTNEKYGKKPEKRDIKDYLNKGFINLDKPSGPTSHKVADYVKKILKIKSCGHGGTLDPKVTGVLPIGINKATKILQVFLHGGKEYVCEMRIHSEVSKKVLLNAFKHFTGRIKQLPPIKSNVKRRWREREIYYIDVLTIKPKIVLFKVGCEAGTYIRKLCTDLGEYMGTKAHMQELRRTKASCLKEENSVTLFDLQDAITLYKEKGDESLLRKYIIPMEKAVNHLKKIIVSDGGVAAISYGAKLMLPGVVKLDNDIKKNDFIAMMSLKGELIGLGYALMNSEEMIKKSKGIAINTTKVLINTGVYPRSWKK